MKKILHISKYYYPFIGGIEQTARDVVVSLKDNYEQKVICFNHEKKTKIDFVDNIEITRVNCQVKISSQSIALSYGKYLKKIIKEFNPDIVIFHYPNPFVAHSLMKFLKKKTFKLLLYWHLDITKQKILGKLFKGQTKRLIKYSDKIIVASQNYKDGSAWINNCNKTIIIPSCINEERMQYNDKHIKRANEIKKKYEGKTICFAFGRHVEYKGLTYLIKASNLLDDNYKILIGGCGPLTESLKKEAKNDSKIEFIGKPVDDELKSYLLACDIFCFPSITKNEAFGLGLAEAMYYKKPVITFTIPGSGVNFVSLKNVTGLECDNKNVEQYAEAIKTIANDESLRLKLGEAGHNRVLEKFTFKEYKKKINDIINQE